MIFIRRRGGSDGGCDLALCKDCADSRGITAREGNIELNIDELIGSAQEGAVGRIEQTSCPSCGLDVATLRREGHLGCLACADAFPAEIAKILGPETARSAESETSPNKERFDAGLAASLRLELGAALRAEAYEEAARLRDELTAAEAGGVSPKLRPPGTQDGTEGESILLSPLAFASSEGPEDDVVLLSSARVYRNVAAIPFPRSPRAPSHPSRLFLAETILSLGGWSSVRVSELGPASRRSLSERGLAPRHYVAEDEALVLLSRDGSTFALLDEIDHLRIRSTAAGLQPELVYSAAAGRAELIGEAVDFARRPGIGWICSRLSDCGIGASLSATVHIPALTATGLRDRLFRSLLSEGISLRGFYSASEDSSGSVYEILLDGAGRGPLDHMIHVFSSTLARVVAAERRAREGIAARGGENLRDAEGRALGVARYCALLGADEAASLLSALRLASLRGALRGADHRLLGSLLLSLGQGSIAVSAGLREIPAAVDAVRAASIKSALSDADYRFEEGQ
jgi:protein-arginine kinase/protein-arginine kinase activator protein McsA